MRVEINKLEDKIMEVLRTNNVFAMDPELKEKWYYGLIIILI